MALYLLDTDHITLIQRGHPEISARYRSTPESDIAVSIVSYEEQLRGRLLTVRRAITPEQVSLAYRLMREMQGFFCRMHLLGFDHQAALIYERLRVQYRRAGAMDLRIAATAIANDAVLVTRNTQDFDFIENLKLESWG